MASLAQHQRLCGVCAAQCSIDSEAFEGSSRRAEFLSSRMDRLEDPGPGNDGDLFVRLANAAFNGNNRLLGLIDFQQREKVFDRCPLLKLHLDSLRMSVSGHLKA